MALTATGIGSGLDISTIVKVLVDAEKLPKEAIFNRTEDRINAKVSAIGTLKSALSNFQDAAKKLQSGELLSQRKVSTGDSPYFTAKASSLAQSGSYSIKVEQLAQAHKVGGAHVTDPKAAVGEGSLDFSINGENFSVGVDPADDLYAIAAKVNSASDNSGVVATVVKSDAGSQIVFSSAKTGLDNQISVVANDIAGTGLNDMFNGTNLNTLVDAKNSIIEVDGQKLTSQSNSVTDAIAGITLDLTKADLNSTSTLTVEQDNEAVKENLKSFVETYNSLLTSIEKLSSYDADKKTAAALQGDSMIRSLESQLRNMVSERVSVDGSNVALYDIGLSTDRYGKLNIDEAKLDESIANNMSSIEGLFSTPSTGLANRFDELANNYVKTGGVIDNRKNSYTEETKRLTLQRESFSLKMAQLESRLLKQFNAMDLVVAQLNQQSAGLVDRLNSLPGAVSKN
ncbi:flagellar filament capping protein FliD [Shewanella holmiensis]|uniref:Flagellar hook-associated protein 2 n=1 Tax=Shewanella holmiensis TaxID=2952222 RepID=A0A9X2WLP2_9GAMM|nr:flagellar filament capping protein FliD [Shewanella holmiensis]MCT7941638.1 flagellar filament capping protein FliD [Shewanella holmiensis]